MYPKNLKLMHLNENKNENEKKNVNLFWVFKKIEGKF